MYIIVQLKGYAVKKIPFVRDAVRRHLLCAAASLFCFLGVDCARSPTGPGSSLPDTTSHAPVTSHSFVWDVDTIGAEGSVLYDCCIINDTIAYAVGNLYGWDSTGQSDRSNRFNAAIWNGITWTMIQVPYDYQGQPVYNPIQAVCALSANDVWFGGNGLEHWDGQQFLNIDTVNSFWSGHLMQKIWASSDRNIYIVGDAGTAVQYDGSWHGIQTNTTLPFQDIWGDGGQVLAVASDKFGLGGKYLVQLNSNTATPLNDSIPYGNSLSGIWFKANQKYFLAGDGIYNKQNLSNNLWQLDSVQSAYRYYSFAVRGNSVNDIVIAGDQGSVAHWNGKDWKIYDELHNTMDRLLSVDIHGDQIIAVGNRYYDGIHNYGVIYHGRR